tara:strand:+ start:1658 stop:2392 length:735 start_codon:yes stop_codon:yes gene_type:complete
VKKTGLIFIVILLSGIFFFREGNFSYSGNSLTINQSKIILNNPSWNITSKKSSSSYKLTSNKAQQNDSDEVFFIEEPSLKTLSSNQIERSISSKKAKLELYKEKLIMEKKVHLRILDGKDIIHLYTEILNLDLANNIASTEHQVEVKSNYFLLNGGGFLQKVDSQGKTQIVFTKAVLNQDQGKGYEKIGRADSVLLTKESGILILKGSAELNLESMKMTADEIKYNYRTRKVLSSKNSLLVKQT